MKTYKGHAYSLTDITTDKHVERARHIGYTVTARLYDIPGLKPAGQRPFLTSTKDVKDYIDAKLSGKPFPKVGAGDRIRSARMRAGLTQQQLGEALGLTNQYARVKIARIEAGTSPVPMEYVRRFAELLHLDALDLLP